MIWFDELQLRDELYQKNILIGMYRRNIVSNDFQYVQSPSWQTVFCQFAMMDPVFKANVCYHKYI